jgi:hypothetical protein
MIHLSRAARGFTAGLLMEPPPLHEIACAAIQTCFPRFRQSRDLHRRAPIAFLKAWTVCVSPKRLRQFRSCVRLAAGRSHGAAGTCWMSPYHGWHADPHPLDQYPSWSVKQREPASAPAIAECDDQMIASTPAAVRWRTNNVITRAERFGSRCDPGPHGLQHCIGASAQPTRNYIRSTRVRCERRSQTHGSTTQCSSVATTRLTIRTRR